MTDIFLAELQEDALSEGKAFDGVAFGDFKDMLGRDITLSSEDADSFVSNTQAAIDATTTEGGELVGLPIDARGHDKGDAAGWIIGIQKSGELIQVIPKWTKVGRELIGQGVRRFFSATIDIKNKVILGGTLTNWPATRNEKGHIMLRPIEMSSGLYGFEEDKNISEQTEQDSDTLLETRQQETSMAEELEVQEPTVKDVPEIPVEPHFSELMKEASEQVELNSSPLALAKFIEAKADERAEARMTQLLNESQRDWQLTQLVAELTSNGERGLPVKPDILLDFMMGLNGENFDKAAAIFKQITNSGLVEFTEYGHSRRMKKKVLAPVYHASLAGTIAAGNSVQEWFDTMAELGNPSDYDLSRFEEA